MTRDKAALCDKLRLKEEQLATFKSSLAQVLLVLVPMLINSFQLNVEYMKELGEVKEAVAVLTDQVIGTSRHL